MRYRQAETSLSKGEVPLLLSKKTRVSSASPLRAPKLAPAPLIMAFREGSMGCNGHPAASIVVCSWVQKLARWVSEGRDGQTATGFGLFGCVLRQQKETTLTPTARQGRNLRKCGNTIGAMLPRHAGTYFGRRPGPLGCGSRDRISTDDNCLLQAADIGGPYWHSGHWITVQHYRYGHRNVQVMSR